MPREPKTKVIEHDGDTFAFICTPLPATKGLAILTRLTKMVGQSLLMLAARGAKGMEGVPDDIMAFTTQTLVERLEEDVVIATVKELCATVQAKDHGELKGATFDALFSARMFLLFQVVQYALETNYSDFFDAIRSRKLGPKVAEAPAA